MAPMLKAQTNVFFIVLFFVLKVKHIIDCHFNLLDNKLVSILNIETCNWVVNAAALKVKPSI